MMSELRERRKVGTDSDNLNELIDSVNNRLKNLVEESANLGDGDNYDDEKINESHKKDNRNTKKVEPDLRWIQRLKSDLANSGEKILKKSEEKKSVNNTIIEAGSYWLTRIVFLRFIAFIYLVAFLVSLHQNKELIGNNGLTPARNFLLNVGDQFPDLYSRMIHVPTLLWFGSPWDDMDLVLDGIALTGAGLAVVVLLTGVANMIVMFTMWILYHSLVNVGQAWFSFGWESQLLETGFLAIWCVPVLSWIKMPRKLPPPWVCVWGFRWLIFRIMIGAGLIKVRGDPCWRDLTCMNYFYQTQPVPNPMAYYAHQAPEGWHKFETFGNHVIELVFPWFTFIPFRAAWIFNGCWQIIFQLVLISTGNLSFLNWLTIAPSIWYLDDKFLAFLFSESSCKNVIELQEEDKILKEKKKFRTPLLRQAVTAVIACLLAYLSLPIIYNLASPNQAMNRSFDPLRIVNTYGAFGSVTKTRTEVVIEGTLSSTPSLPNTVWEEYEFKCKPGNTSSTPCLISPYHYRLDWLMWFAAFQQYQQNPWLLHLMGKMMENDPVVDSLIKKNPFKGKKPPKFVRAMHYKYTFTSLGSKKARQNNWWKRKLIGEYVPQVNLEMLSGVYKQFGWKTGKESSEIKS